MTGRCQMIKKLLTRAEVETRVGLTCSSIYRLMRSGEFPSPIKVGPRAVRWPSNEIEAWLAGRPRATGEVANIACSRCSTTRP